jgi:two-component system sensor histidine kinase KdpD
MSQAGTRGSASLAGADAAQARRPAPITGLGVHQRAAVAAGGLVGMTAVMWMFGSRLHLDLAMMLYLLAVVIVAITVGRLAGLVAAVVSYLLALYFFAPPRGAFDLDERHHLIELTVFLVVAALVGVVADAATRHRIAANRHRQELADEVARNQQLAEIDRVRAGLLSAVSHDLRTPLAGIKANAAALKYADPSWSSEVRLQLLTSIEESADRLTDMVSNVLDLSRIRAGALKADLTAVALYEVVSRALVSVGDRSTTVNVAEDLPAVWADPALLERVIVNLVTNAHEHGPDGAPVLIRADRVEVGVRVAVVDHGPGIAEDRWAEVFQPFQRLADTGGGLGLGLAISRSFCEAMGTSLTPSHTPGGGLTMSVALAAAP